MDKVHVWAVIVVILCCYLGASQACSCLPNHPQYHFCKADFVIRANIRSQHKETPIMSDVVINATMEEKTPDITEESVVLNETDTDDIDTDEYESYSQSESEYVPMTPMEHSIIWTVKVQKVYKGKDLMKNGDIVEIMTAEYAEMCGLTYLQIGTSYILSGITTVGMYNVKLNINVCDWYEPWTSVTKKQKTGCKNMYANNCDCQIFPCYDDEECNELKRTMSKKDKNDEKDGKRSKEKGGSRSEEEVGSRSEEEVGSRSEERGGSRSEEKGGSRSEEKGGSRSEEKDSSQSEKEGCILSNIDGACYVQHSACQRKRDGSCGWYNNKDLKKCLNPKKPKKPKPKHDKPKDKKKKSSDEDLLP